MAQMTESEYYQQVAAELQQSFANSLAGLAANYEGQLAMLKVQHKAELDALKAEFEAGHSHDEPVEDAPAPKQTKRK